LSAIDYQPEFQHTDWVDNVSRVKAGGEDGFNRHFHDTEDEFKKLSDTVKSIRERLDQLGQPPAPPTVTTTFTPTLVPLAAGLWDHVYGTVAKPATAVKAGGMMSITLPHGATLRTLRAVGRNTGAGSLQIGLRRQALAAGSASELLMSVTGQGAGGGLFDPAPTPAPGGESAKINTNLFRYYLTVELDSAATADTVEVRAIQVTYTAA
jgi:hypothetical protein